LVQLQASKLELDESEKILKWAKDSTELYSTLPQYYKSISEKNNIYKDHSKQLSGLGLSLSLLLVGDIRNAIPQQGQNTPSWEK
jgi:hypothetical protein